MRFTVTNSNCLARTNCKPQCSVADTKCQPTSIVISRFKYALWTGAVGRCVLYSCRFLDPLIWWLATGNKWKRRQLARPKPNDAKSLESWASQTRWASGQRSMTQTTKNSVLLCWRTLMKLWKRCDVKKNHLSRHLLNLEVLPASKALKPYTTLSSTSTANCFAPMFKQKLDRCIVWWPATIVWDVPAKC